MILKLKEAMKEAMKNKEKIRLDTIRLLLSEIQYEEMQKNVSSLSDDAILSILKREVKKRKEEVEFAQKGNRADLISKLNEEISVIDSFLPKQLDNEEIRRIVVEFKNSSSDPSLSNAMKYLKEQFSGRYDGRAASDIVKEVLS